MHFRTASFTFSTLTSEKPLILRRVLVVAESTDYRKGQPRSLAAHEYCLPTYTDSKELIVLELSDIGLVDAYDDHQHCRPQ